MLISSTTSMDASFSARFVNKQMLWEFTSAFVFRASNDRSQTLPY
jgi:hypothetical protein